MPDMMGRAMTWLSRKRRQFLARPVLYERCDDQGEILWQLTVPAVLGGADATGEASVEPVRIDAADLDFLIAARDLRYDGEPVEPTTDDRIYSYTNGRAHAYEILPRGNTPWRWSDPQKTNIRIHTRLVDDSPAPEASP